MKRRTQPISWMAGYTTSPSLEATALALEQRLRQREVIGQPFSDAIARKPLAELMGWFD